ncbi:deoxyribonuclease NucA/NucB [Cupriavidus gilardii J11]|uniref:Deoxyribonuclease NucA/NucB n=1 Tax=Cupriavidus gilardii J11 TaxID=936133 RepID=A0A562BTA8_9BURK|nr:deoxyribonuclease NucA/NucB [Cupriavidus gilardii J11]
MGVWRDWSSPKRLWAAAPVLMGSLLAGCAGPSRIATPVARMAPQDSGPPVLVRPLDVPSVTVEKCANDGDFIPMVDPTPGNNQRRALVSRHVDCRSGESDLIELDAPLEGSDSIRRDTDPVMGSDRNVIKGRKLRIASKMSVYGPSNMLQKQISLTLRAIDYVPRRSDVDAVVLPTIRVRPVLECGPAAELLGSRPLCTVVGNPIALRLDGSEATGDYTVSFDWARLPGQRKDVVTFDLTFNTFAFSVEGEPTDAVQHEFDPQLDAAGLRIRCDRGVARTGSNGCIFPEAAAVFWVSSAPVIGAEAVRHMIEALDEGAPGRFGMQPGFRAVADAAVAREGMALQRTQMPVMRDANRYASCGNVKSSIIRQRPKHSESCASSGGKSCDCDEYPFASTYQGAFENRSTTSAKYVLGSDNRAVGSALATFYASERVIDLSYETGERGVPTNPYPSFVRDYGGDLFWIYVAPGPQLGATQDWGGPGQP